MKSRAPRCRDFMSVMSVPACWSAISPPSCARAKPAGSSATAIISNRLIMTRDPLRHGLHAVEARVPRHQQKESEIKDGADLGQHRIDAGRRLQAAEAERDEGQHEDRQHDLVERPSVADRSYRRA